MYKSSKFMIAHSLAICLGTLASFGQPYPAQASLPASVPTPITFPKISEIDLRNAKSEYDLDLLVKDVNGQSRTVVLVSYQGGEDAKAYEKIAQAAEIRGMTTGEILRENANRLLFSPKENSTPSTDEKSWFYTSFPTSSLWLKGLQALPTLLLGHLYVADARIKTDIDPEFNLGRYFAINLCPQVSVSQASWDSCVSWIDEKYKFVQKVLLAHTGYVAAQTALRPQFGDQKWYRILFPVGGYYDKKEVTRLTKAINVSFQKNPKLQQMIVPVRASLFEDVRTQLIHTHKYQLATDSLTSSFQ